MKEGVCGWRVEGKGREGRKKKAYFRGVYDLIENVLWIYGIHVACCIFSNFWCVIAGAAAARILSTHYNETGRFLSIGVCLVSQ